MFWLPPQNKAHATFMQPLQYVSQHPVANLHLSTHMGTPNDNNHAATPMRRSVTTDSTNAKHYAHRQNHALQNTEEEPILRPERPQPQPPHTHEVPFIAACSHFTQKFTRNFVLRLPPQHKRHHFPSSPLPFLTTSLRHHFPRSPLPFVTTLCHSPTEKPFRNTLYKACTKYFPALLCTIKACTKHFPVLPCTTKLAQSTSQYHFVLQKLLYYKTCTKHVPVLLCTTCTKYFPVLLCATKLAQSTSQWYFVLQSLHKALPSTTLYYKACTKHFPAILCSTQSLHPALLCTAKLAQSTSQYYFVPRSLRKAFPSTFLYYKACTKYAPVLLCETKFAQIKLLHTASSFAEKLLHTASFYTQQAFAQRSFYT